jgi:hypothetical protein
LAKVNEGCLSCGSQRTVLVCTGASFKRSVHRRTALPVTAGHRSSKRGGLFTGLLHKKLPLFNQRCQTHSHECSFWHAP